KEITKGVERGAEVGFTDVALDIQRTSSDASPFKTGHLEKNHLDIDMGRKGWTATIWFEAFNQGFDYGLWIHEGHYNLGEGSLAKKGGSSQFAGSVPVGRRYASRVVEQGGKNYQMHIIEKMAEGLEGEVTDRMSLKKFLEQYIDGTPIYPSDFPMNVSDCYMFDFSGNTALEENLSETHLIVFRRSPDIEEAEQASL